MSFMRDIYQNGSVKTTGIGVARKQKVNRVKAEEEIQICLNCTEEKCRGSCEKIKELYRRK